MRVAAKGYMAMPTDELIPSDCGCVLRQGEGGGERMSKRTGKHRTTQHTHLLKRDAGLFRQRSDGVSDCTMNVHGPRIIQETRTVSPSAHL